MIFPTPQGICQRLVILLLLFLCLDKSLLLALEWDGDIYHHNALVVVTEEDNVQSQLASQPGTAELMDMDPTEAGMAWASPG